MSPPNRRILLLALGNDLLGDDGAGLAAARILRRELEGAVEIVESSGAGFELLELLEGYESVLLLDAIVTGGHPPGTVLELSREDFQEVLAPSSHYVGIPEILKMAERLGVPFPKEMRILALKVEDPYELREGLTPAVERALPAFVERARQVLEGWRFKGVPSVSVSDIRQRPPRSKSTKTGEEQ